MINSTDYENNSSLEIVTRIEEIHNNECGIFYNYSIDILRVYYLPFIIIFGLVGNTLSCIVFLTTHLKLRSSSYYLAALAISDSGFLTTLLVLYLTYMRVVDVFNHEGLCQFFVYASGVFSALSTWLIVAFTVERFIAVQYPLRRPYLCTVSRAKIILTILSSIALFSQIYSFWTAGLIGEKKYMCDLKPEYEELMKMINLIDTITTLIVPLILIVTMNTMIAKNLLMFNRRFKRSSVGENSNVHRIEIQNTLAMSSGSSLNTKSTSESKQKISPFSSQQNNSFLRFPLLKRTVITTNGQQNVTKVLFLISTIFVCLNLPSYFLRLYCYVYYVLGMKTSNTLMCLQEFTMMLFYTNFSINFVLYAMYGITFRNCLKQVLWNFLRRVRCLFKYKNIKNLFWRKINNIN